MATNTNSTTTTRRNVLAGMGAATAALVPTAAAAASAASAASSSTTNEAAVLAAWRAWRPLEEEDWTISAAINDIYAKHPRTREIPSVRVFDVDCMSDENIDQVCQRAPAWMQSAIPQLRESAKRELAAERRRLEELEDQIGMTRLYARQEETDAIRGELFDLIDKADGYSAVIVAAKLDCALSHLSGHENLADCGPSSIASAIHSLLPQLPVDMREKLAPIAAKQGRIRQIYTRTA